MNHECNQEQTIKEIRSNVVALELARESDSRAVLDRLAELGDQVDGIGHSVDRMRAKVELFTEWRREQAARRKLWPAVLLAVVGPIVTAGGGYLIATHVAQASHASGSR